MQMYFETGLTCGVPDGVLDSSVGHDGRGGEPLAGPGRAVALKWWKDFFCYSSGRAESERCCLRWLAHV